MAGFTSYDDLISKITSSGNSFQYDFTKIGTTSIAAGNWTSLARVGGNPAAISDGAAGSGTAGAGGTALDQASGTLTAGLGDEDPERKFLLTLGAVSNVSLNLRLYDRLVHVSGLAMNSTGDKDVNSVTLPRYTGTDSAGVEAWLEYTTAGTTTATVVHMSSYTDQDGNTGSTGTSVTGVASQTIQSMIKLPLAAGDTGIRSVETINVSTACTAGVAQLVLLKPLVTVALSANSWQERDLVLQLTALPRILDGASLCLMYETTATTAATVTGTIRLAWG